MERRIRFRIGVLLILILLILTVLAGNVYKMQNEVSADELPGGTTSTYTYYTTVSAARGNILDRNGVVLVTNRASYNLVLTNYALFNSSDPNGSLLTLLEACVELGVDYADHLPVSFERPYTYTTDELSETWQGYFKSYLREQGWDSDMSAENLIRQMRRKYSIPSGWTDEQIRRVVGLRFELSLRYYSWSSLGTYTLTEDISSEDMAALLELGTPGLSVESTTVREYETDLCAHILGRVGPIYAEEYETYSALGYAMNAQVGKDGVEEAFEEYLHGTDGTRVTTIDSTGEIVEQYYSTEPVAGSNVVLSIDINLQAAAEQALEDVILSLRETGVGTDNEGTDAEGGALVVLDVNTFEVLASASYPTFDLSTYSQEFNQLRDAEGSPLYNRVLLASYPPGSVFKMVTSIAAIDHAGIGRYYTIRDEGLYTYYEDYQPACLLWKRGMTHGTINMMQALAESCNYYFYEVGRLTGIDAIDEVAEALGLGESTGVELYEETGTRGNPETKKSLYGDDPNQSDWYGADTLQVSIGQGDSRFTPMQLACYTAALANGGTRYSATYLRRVVSSDYSAVLVQHEPEVLSTLEISDDALACIREGMRMVVSEGTASSYLKDYSVAVCAKTGTAQHGGSGSDNASFVCYAPADDPQIAIVVYVEKGAQGGYLANAARAVMDAYFGQADGSQTVVIENIVQ
jgi:penicillin-binding protein 2